MDGVRHSRREATWFRAIAWLGMASGFVSPAMSQVGQPHVETFTVQAATEWTETGIFLLPGDQLLVRTPGAPGWTNATNGELKNAAGWGGRFAGTKVADAPLAALIQRIGADDTGEMVSRTPITVSRRGRLAFGMNDLPGTYADNQGSLTVSVQYLQQPVPMPRVVDLDQETAARQFAPFGIVPTVEYRESPTVKGVVLDVVPDRNSEMHSVESVRLIVSSGPPLAPPEVLVPNITGRPGAEAERMLIEAGLAPSNMGLEESGIQQDGTVTRSRPMGGEKVAPGSTVEYWTARPDVTDTDEGDTAGGQGDTSNDGGSSGGKGGTGDGADSSGSKGGTTDNGAISGGTGDPAKKDRDSGSIWWWVAIGSTLAAITLQRLLRRNDGNGGARSPTITAALGPGSETRFSAEPKRSSGNVQMRASLAPGDVALPRDLPISKIEVGDD